eukprot:531365-Pelagomonas_calceolata.AAC.2
MDMLGLLGGTWNSDIKHFWHGGAERSPHGHACSDISQLALAQALHAPLRGGQGGAGTAQGPQDNAFGVPMGTFDPNLGYITYDQMPPGATRPDPTYWPQRLPAPRYAVRVCTYTHTSWFCAQQQLWFLQLCKVV